MTTSPSDSGAEPFAKFDGFAEFSGFSGFSAFAEFSEAQIAWWRSGRLSAAPPPSRPGVPSVAADSPEDVVVPTEPDEPVLFVPDELPAGPVPLVVLLHGAQSTPADVLPIMEAEAQRRGVLLLAPKSIDYTWDVIVGGAFGPDVAALDSALSEVFERFDVDPSRIAVAGISDGASYALSLALANGDLFRRVVAFSPGYFAAGHRGTRPDIFVSHGRQDTVLPIEKTSWRVVSLLKRTGHHVTFREFDGGHEAPPEMVAAAMDFLTG